MRLRRPGSYLSPPGLSRVPGGRDASLLPEGVPLHSDTQPGGGSLRRCMRWTRRGANAQDGPFANLDARGVVLRRGEYTDGTPSGTWTTFYSNGKRKSEGRMEGNIPQGLWTEWFEDGRVLATKEYEQGRVVRYDGRPFSGFGVASEHDQAFYIQRAPQVAIVRVTELLADMPSAMDPGTVIFEVVEPLRASRWAASVAASSHSSSSGMKVGMVAIAGIAPEPDEVSDLINPPQKLQGYVTGVIPFPSVEEARKQAHTRVPGLGQSRSTP